MVLSYDPSGVHPSQVDPLGTDLTGNILGEDDKASRQASPSKPQSMLGIISMDEAAAASSTITTLAITAATLDAPNRGNRRIEPPT